MKHNTLPDDPELRGFYLEADLGIAVAQFLKTTVGQYLLTRAAEEKGDALAALVEVDATDVERIRTLQSDIKRADSIESWLSEAVINGRNAENVLLGQDAKENEA